MESTRAGFPIVLLLLAGLRCISGGKVNSLPANRSEEDPCRPVFTLGISSTRTSTCTAFRLGQKRILFGATQVWRPHIAAGFKPLVASDLEQTGFLDVGMVVNYDPQPGGYVLVVA